MHLNKMLINFNKYSYLRTCLCLFLLFIIHFVQFTYWELLLKRKLYFPDHLKLFGNNKTIQRCPMRFGISLLGTLNSISYRDETYAPENQFTISNFQQVGRYAFISLFKQAALKIDSLSLSLWLNDIVP